MPLQQMGAFSFNHADQQDKLYKTLTAAEIKAAFDSRGNELKTALNNLITALQATTDGDSGADNIGVTTITDVTGNTVQAVLESLKSLIDQVEADLQNQIASVDADLQAQITSNDTDITDLQQTDTTIANNLETHKSSSDHDTRYYTKTELDGYLRGGDTVIKYEVFTIISSDNGDGTFTYEDADGAQHTGTLTAEGYQRFTLAKGEYTVGENRIEALVNDTLSRTAASGGLREVDATTVDLTVPEGNGAEITFKYFERIGLMGEHAVSHEIGGGDEITGLVGVGNTEPVATTLWFKVVG